MNDYRQTIRLCPLCRAVLMGPSEDTPRDDVCDICAMRPLWEALPQAVRDEVGAVVDEKSAIPAGYLLAELDGGRRPTMEYMRITSYRRRVGERTCRCAETEHGRVSWSCPSCDRRLMGCDETHGEICRPCGLGPAWEALPRAVRDEIGAMVDAGAVMDAPERLRELDEFRRDNFDYTLMIAYRGSVKR
ncbi:hypothetical protein BBK82_20810 [Lentzea guizhouensis]|uniref:Uncharacterized protein n=1 Tax=Lentzea guizhouensis TaxID=1586287 RepID=A0A1B2HK96_9PSEU|nr:hypothetical protein [Lentzea guizhouensis]ANZ38137.1 hypothetical protein BBK82_20810 [Lentzea guizhouensis]